jgi:phenylacetic acid degradation operon negative regulatory protein
MLHFLIAVLNNRVNTPDAVPPAGALADEVALRPLTPRSIVLSVLLGTHPPAMPVRRLLDVTTLFGISDGTARTALSRMVAAGELIGEDGVYRLAGPLLVRQREQDAGRADPPTSWDGSWWFAIVIAERRSLAQRRDFRARAVGARLGELRADTWIRPTNIDVPHDLGGVVLIRGPLVSGDGHELAARLWDLDALDRRARALNARLDTSIDALQGAERDPVRTESSLPEAFVELATAQRFLRAEPQLPTALAPSTAPADLRRTYRVAVTLFQDRLREFFDRAGTA